MNGERPSKEPDAAGKAPIHGNSCRLEEVAGFIRRFVVVSEAQADALALWTAHTHALDAAESTPYLAITSPEKRSGKTRLLEVLELLTCEALPSANISDAALFRVVAAKHPTLLFDEADAVFKARDREELRGLLNAGHRRGAVAHRMGGANNRTLETFPVFCPKALAGIGNCLPDTIIDRSIPVRLQRRTRQERVERFRRRMVAPEGESLRASLADWLEPQLDYLAGMHPDLPEELDDRAQDSWEPLLALAELAGGNWPERARRAALALSTGEDREDESLTAQLLRDLHDLFAANGHKRFKTSDLLEQLHAIEESPWGEWYGKPLSAHALSRLLRPYRIKTMPVKVDGETVRGYKVEQFEDAFHRLSVTRVTGVTHESASGAEGNARNAGNAYPSKGRPLPGDEFYPLSIADAGKAGHLTEDEFSELYAHHKLVERAREARAA